MGQIPSSYYSGALNSFSDTKSKIFQYIMQLVKSNYFTNPYYNKYNNFILNIHLLSKSSTDISSDILNLFLSSSASNISSMNSFQYTLGNNLFNISNCESNLRDTYKIADNDPIYLISIEYLDNINVMYNLTFQNITTNSLFLYIYHKNINMTDPTSLCKNESIYYHLQDEVSTSLLNYNKYMMKENIFVFDMNTAFFTSRCYKYVSNDSYPIFTLNQRIRYFFPNLTVSCINYLNKTNPSSCKFIGFFDFYIICECSALEEFSAGFFYTNIKFHPTYNFDIILCWPQIFNVNPFINLAQNKQLFKYRLCFKFWLSCSFTNFCYLINNME